VLTAALKDGPASHPHPPQNDHTQASLPVAQTRPLNGRYVRGGGPRHLRLITPLTKLDKLRRRQRLHHLLPGTHAWPAHTGAANKSMYSPAPDRLLSRRCPASPAGSPASPGRHSKTQSAKYVLTPKECFGARSSGEPASAVRFSVAVPGARRAHSPLSSPAMPAVSAQDCSAETEVTNERLASSSAPLLAFSPS